MATFATPGIAISLGRIVQRASVVRSICERTFDETPILRSRLVDESGERITGGLATTGSRVASTASRSCTSCRARIRSVPSAKIITTDDRPSTDFDRSVFSPCVPFERVLERHADQGLDLVGRQPRRLGLDLDQGRRELGEHVQGRVLRLLDADDDQDDRQGQHQHPEPQDVRDEPVHHEMESKDESSADERRWPQMERKLNRFLSAAIVRLCG